MKYSLTEIITSSDPSVRDFSIDEWCRQASLETLLGQCDELDAFRRRSGNLYERVRALFFLYAVHRFHLPSKLTSSSSLGRGLIPFSGYHRLLHRRFEEAIDEFLAVQRLEKPSVGVSSALAAAYQRLGFQTLSDQVRRSVRMVHGNQWMFRMGHPADHPLRFRRELLRKGDGGAYPLLRERTPVRMDLSHSAWSDIFFLGMDFPEGARVLNVSIDLGVHGVDPQPRPPVEAYLRVIEEPVLRLTSVDLSATADLTSVAEVFDFARDHLGLLKAAVIAAGLVPPGIEGSGRRLDDLLEPLVGPGRGLELVSSVNHIPKGSRLAVSTTLLAGLITACMRATGQTRELTGALDETERRIVLARALLGEWLGGSGGGWQDSGGVWPGVKLIEGVLSTNGDPEWGVSRGRLMPRHRVLNAEQVPRATRDRLSDSLVLVHGGMAQNVGPILEMVTEKYLLRSGAEWQARRETTAILDEILEALATGDVRAIGAQTTHNFFGPLQTIIPWASNQFTETVIERMRHELGADFWGFWMLGGMAGGGMGFIVAPERRAEAQSKLQAIMSSAKRELEHALPFAIEPVVYDFAINDRGTWGDYLDGADALLPPGYYAQHVPGWLRTQPNELSNTRRSELDKVEVATRTRPEFARVVQDVFDRLLPRLKSDDGRMQSLAELLSENGFDVLQHEQIRDDLRNGRIGLSQNRLNPTADVRDVRSDDVIDATGGVAAHLTDRGLAALTAGELAIVTLAAGSGSRWTQGAGIVKGLHPFAKLGGRYRTFIETHLAKSRRVSARAGGPALPHVFTTSWLTHEAISRSLERTDRYGYRGPVRLSPGRAVGLRMNPTVRELRFLWEETPQQMLDERQQKVRESGRAALLAWARQVGEASDYTDNLPSQCLHPVGHWFEISNMLRNGVLSDLLAERPALKHLFVHNVDTLGADADPAYFGLHLEHGTCLTFEVIRRQIEDRGGGLARVDDRLRLVEGLAMPREEDEFKLSYYNSNSCWIDIDQLLGVFSLSRADLSSAETVTAAVRRAASRVQTYITVKDVKKRWGHGQEDTFPVLQWEKLWGDMTALPEVSTTFLEVPRFRGQQLKDQAQLDGWLRDGTARYVETLCEWS